jgi:hypothetical protein
VRVVNRPGASRERTEKSMEDTKQHRVWIFVLGFLVLFYGGAFLGIKGGIDEFNSIFQSENEKLIVQEAKCEMRADSIYRATDKDGVFIPTYIARCMTVSGYDYVGLLSSVCERNFTDAARAAQLVPGGYSLEEDISCYRKHPNVLFGS